ncbi:MAG: hypothetical protein WD989_00205 [Candidatus Paceibacterota bacterium]
MTKASAQIQPVNPILVSNVILFGILGLLLSFYVIQANMIAADRYNIKILNEKLASLNEVRTSLVAERSKTEDQSKLIEFALSIGMVEAKNVSYVFENGNVALRQ